MGDATEQVSITQQVPIHHVASFKQLLERHPRLHYTVQGMIVQKFIIMGAPADIEAFRPKLRDWQHDCASGDAW